MAKDRILVVDDDKDILELLSYNLERQGYKVQTIDASTQAVRACIQFEPDLIILDMMMPEINGIEVCRSIRSLEKFKETIIFFLTAKSENYYRAAALETGANDFIEKIIGVRSLMDKIKLTLNTPRKLRSRKD
jgi:two-component system, OmpR family, alkaline phosphatase synthesis response regulator PhoP